MQDPRLMQLAELMLDHSLQLRRQEAIRIAADVTAIPLVKALLIKARERGVLAQVDLLDSQLQRLQLELLDADDPASRNFLADKAQSGMRRFENLVGDIILRASPNDQEMSQIPAAVLQMVARENKPLKDLLINHRRWVLFDYPTPAQAQRAGLPFDTFTDFVLNAASVDYAQMKKDVMPLVELMQRTDEVRITGKDTDLRFSIQGIPVIPCCGESNIPDGECFTAPVRQSVQGHLHINTPSVFWGQVFTDIHFEFKDGKIVKATAAENSDRLNEILDNDAGARYIGEFSLGFNPLIKDPFMNTLFDEKISGSFHFTPGSCYDEAPNGNDSAIHWDLVHIQRPEYGGGSIYFDGVKIRDAGRFLLPQLQALNP